MPKCDECQDTGNCPCGATDCNERCSECYCQSCSSSGMELVLGKHMCKTCVDDLAQEEREARAEDAWDDRPGRGMK